MLHKNSKPKMRTPKALKFTRVDLNRFNQISFLVVSALCGSQIAYSLSNKANLPFPYLHRFRILKAKHHPIKVNVRILRDTIFGSIPGLFGVGTFKNGLAPAVKDHQGVVFHRAVGVQAEFVVYIVTVGGYELGGFFTAVAEFSYGASENEPS
jgi:hypothetical protein